MAGADFLTESIIMNNQQISEAILRCTGGSFTLGLRLELLDEPVDAFAIGAHPLIFMTTRAFFWSVRAFDASRAILS